MPRLNVLSAARPAFFKASFKAANSRQRLSLRKIKFHTSVFPAFMIRVYLSTVCRVSFNASAISDSGLSSLIKSAAPILLAIISLSVEVKREERTSPACFLFKFANKESNASSNNFSVFLSNFLLDK